MNRNCITMFLLSVVTLLSVTITNAQDQDLQPANQIAGSWTIYANNINQPGSSLKAVEITQ
jgi:hypothetical protein